MQTKAWYKSRTVWSIAIGTLLAVQQPVITALEKKSFTPAEAARVFFMALAAGVGIYSRSVADRPLGAADTTEEC
jgi:predicted XRE-type DNA-binding protein